MKMPAIVLIGLTATLFLTAAGSQEKIDSRRAEIDELVKKTTVLQGERIATLRDVLDMSVHLAAKGRAEVTEVLEARMALLRAELDAAEKNSDRIAYCKKALESLKEDEQLAKTLLEAARGTGLNVIKVKATRLEIEVLLGQAKIREAKESK